MGNSKVQLKKINYVRTRDTFRSLSNQRGPIITPIGHDRISPMCPLGYGFLLHWLSSFQKESKNFETVVESDYHLIYTLNFTLMIYMFKQCKSGTMSHKYIFSEYKLSVT